jgi:hypothetical protein
MAFCPELLALLQSFDCFLYYSWGGAQRNPRNPPTVGLSSERAATIDANDGSLPRTFWRSFRALIVFLYSREPGGSFSGR